MDPSVCGMCGFWVRRCTCRANVPHSAPYVEEDGLLGSLPRELLLLIGESCSITMLGHLACVSKELRQLAYSECLWSALHAAAHHGYASVVDALLDGGADVALRTNSGETARELARRELVQIL